MIRLDAATVLAQWAAGGLLFLWVTTRRREVGIGYGWLMRGTYLVLSLASVFVAVRWLDVVPVREASSVGVSVATAVALAVSVVRRRAGVAGERDLTEARRQRVSEMAGIDRPPTERAQGAEFPPWLDLVPVLLAVPGLVAGAVDAGGDTWLAIARTLVGAAFLGAVSDAMLLGHWYLVQPGLARGPLMELVRWTGWIWPIEVGLLLVPTGMGSAITGTVDDGAAGLLTWFWVACAVTTGGLVVITRLALRERYYSAVMAATGLLYLGILTAFGTDLVARAILAA